MNDLDIARDDLALDALAAGRAPETRDDVLGLLSALRTDLDDAAPDAVPAVVPLRPRRPRRLAWVGLSAAAGLVVGGLSAGAVVTADQPDDLLYAARTAILGDSDDTERVEKLIDEALEAMAEGDVREAAKRLDKADERLAEVTDETERAALRTRIDRLRSLLAAPTPTSTRAPSATASPDDDETPEPRETESPDDDSSGSGSGGDDPDDSDNSGSGSSNSGSGSDSSGKGSDDVLKTLDPDDDSSGKGSGSDDG